MEGDKFCHGCDTFKNEKEYFKIVKGGDTGYLCTDCQAKEKADMYHFITDNEGPKVSILYTHEYQEKKVKLETPGHRFTAFAKSKCKGCGERKLISDNFTPAKRYKIGFYNLCHSCQDPDYAKKNASKSYDDPPCMCEPELLKQVEREANYAYWPDWIETSKCGYRRNLGKALYMYEDWEAKETVFTLQVYDIIPKVLYPYDCHETNKYKLSTNAFRCHNCNKVGTVSATVEILGYLDDSTPRGKGVPGEDPLKGGQRQLGREDTEISGFHFKCNHCGKSGKDGLNSKKSCKLLTTNFFRQAGREGLWVRSGYDEEQAATPQPNAVDIESTSLVPGPSGLEPVISEKVSLIDLLRSGHHIVSVKAGIMIFGDGGPWLLKNEKLKDLFLDSVHDKVSDISAVISR